MHGEHAIENLWRDEMILRNDELNAQDRRFDAADYEEEKRVENVKNAELFVIYGDDPFMQAIADRTRAGGGGSERDGFRGHDYACALIAASRDISSAHRYRGRSFALRAS